MVLSSAASRLRRSSASWLGPESARGGGTIVEAILVSVERRQHPFAWAPDEPPDTPAQPVGSTAGDTDKPEPGPSIIEPNSSAMNVAGRRGAAGGTRSVPPTSANGLDPRNTGVAGDARQPGSHGPRLSTHPR